MKLLFADYSANSEFFQLESGRILKMEEKFSDNDNFSGEILAHDGGGRFNLIGLCEASWDEASRRDLWKFEGVFALRRFKIEGVTFDEIGDFLEQLERM